MVEGDEWMRIGWLMELVSSLFFGLSLFMKEQYGITGVGKSVSFFKM